MGLEASEIRSVARGRYIWLLLRMRDLAIATIFILARRLLTVEPSMRQLWPMAESPAVSERVQMRQLTWFSAAVRSISLGFRDRRIAFLRSEMLQATRLT